MEIKTTPPSPHPFTDSGFVGFKEDAFPSNLLENENTLLQWRDQMKKRFNKCEFAQQIFMFLTKPYRMVFLKYAEPYLSQKDLSEILSDVLSLNRYWTVLAEKSIATTTCRKTMTKVKVT
ncbi:MAG: hypothetical protein HFE78_01655 [Clostridiales bacterium]|nr:hypothetical protein [Clostridiales bacterium]